MGGRSAAAVAILISSSLAIAQTGPLSRLWCEIAWWCQPARVVAIEFAPLSPVHAVNLSGVLVTVSDAFDQLVHQAPLEGPEPYRLAFEVPITSREFHVSLDSETVDALVSNLTIDQSNVDGAAAFAVPYRRVTAERALLERVRANDITPAELRNLVGQLLVVGVPEHPYSTAREAQGISAEQGGALRLIRELNVGGFILYRKNIWGGVSPPPASDERLRLAGELIAYLNQLRTESHVHSGIEPILSLDHEGGEHSWLSGIGLATEVPAAMAIGALRDVRSAMEVGRIFGEELAALGFNVNYAPSLDISAQDHNDLIRDRSFGGSPDLVQQLATGVLAGMAGAGITGVVKHYPGHGRSEEGFHTPRLPVSKMALRDLNPTLDSFRYAISDEACPPALAIMSSHYALNTLDASQPISFNPILMGNALRHSWGVELAGATIQGLGFDGVLITDDLLAPSITAVYRDDFSREEAIAASRSNVEEFEVHVLRVMQAAYLSGHDLLMLAHVKPDPPRGVPARGTKRTHSGQDVAYVSELTQSQLVWLVEEFTNWIFESPDRITLLREKLVRVLGFKDVVRENREAHLMAQFGAEISEVPEYRVDAAEFIRLLDEDSGVTGVSHQRMADGLLRDSFTIASLGRGLRDLAHFGAPRSLAVSYPVNILILPDGPTFEQRRQAEQHSWDERSAFARAFRSHYGAIAPTLIAEMNFIDSRDQVFRAEQSVKAVIDSEAERVVFVIATATQWQMTTLVLDRLDRNHGFDLSNVLIIVSTHPTLLSASHASINSDRLSEIIDATSIVVSYGGTGRHADVLVEMLRNQTPIGAISTLPVTVNLLENTPSFQVRNPSAFCRP